MRTPTSASIRRWHRPMAGGVISAHEFDRLIAGEADAVAQAGVRVVPRAAFRWLEEQLLALVEN